jgi:hypothetical protein
MQSMWEANSRVTERHHAIFLSSMQSQVRCKNGAVLEAAYNKAIYLTYV